MKDAQPRQHCNGKIEKPRLHNKAYLAMHEKNKIKQEQQLVCAQAMYPCRSIGASLPEAPDATWAHWCYLGRLMSPKHRHEILDLRDN